MVWNLAVCVVVVFIGVLQHRSPGTLSGAEALGDRFAVFARTPIRRVTTLLANFAGSLCYPFSRLGGWLGCFVSRRRPNQCKS